MKAFTVALPVLALALGAFAGPIAVPDAEPVEMESSDSVLADVMLTVCDHSNFGGRCENLRSVPQKCYNLGNGWPDTISSAKTQPGRTCYLFQHNGCKGKKVELYGGGTGHQDFKKQGINDAISSYRCS